MRLFCFGGLSEPSQPVHDDVQTEPNHVNEVPVPSGTFKPEVALRCEMTFLQAQSDEEQHQSTDEHMKTMKAGEHEEG
jgi:hypothetical protein